MDRTSGILVTLGVLILIVIGLFLFTGWFSNTTGYAIGLSERDELGLCLGDKGTQLYVKDDCPLCDKQIKILGNILSGVLIINCKEGCENVKDYPAWYTNGTFEYGFMNYNQLREFSGC